MRKLINITLMLCMSLGCVKHKTPRDFDSTGIEFMIGQWKWKKSITSDSDVGDKKVVTKSGEVPQYCTLSFSADGILTISTSGGTSTMELDRAGLISIEENRIVHFRNAQHEDITFSWSAGLNQLSTKYKFFNFQLPPCTLGNFLLNNTYEKI